MTDFGIITPSCNENTNYISNHHVLSNISHIYYWDNSAGAWSANLQGSAFPFAFLPPANLQAGDLVVFGIDSTYAYAAPFSSLVFDIATAIGVGGGITITWRYSNAGANPTAWAALTVQDNTNADGRMTGDAFDTTGIKSVHWEKPSNWVDTIDPTIAAVNIGVTGYWVCAHVSAAAGAPTPPTQQNRNIYAVQWPYVEINEDDISGDLHALGHILFRNQSNAYLDNVAPYLYSQRIIGGLRSVSRGEDFTAFINLADNNRADVLVNVLPGAAFTTDPLAPTGRKIRVQNAPAAWTSYASASILSYSLSQYNGKFRLMLITNQYAGTVGNIDLRIQYRLTTGNYTITDVVTPLFVGGTNYWQVSDFGQITILGDGFNITSETLYKFSFLVDIYGDGASDIDLYTLVLMPIDEFSFDTLSTGNDLSFLSNRGHSDEVSIEIDSVSYPKSRIRTLAKHYETDEIINKWQMISNGSVALQSNTTQRFWFLNLLINSNDWWCMRDENSNSIAINMLQRYFSLRGDN